MYTYIYIYNIYIVGTTTCVLVYLCFTRCRESRVHCVTPLLPGHNCSILIVQRCYAEVAGRFCPRPHIEDGGLSNGPHDVSSVVNTKTLQQLVHYSQTCSELCTFLTSGKDGKVHCHHTTVYDYMSQARKSWSWQASNKTRQSQLSKVSLSGPWLIKGGSSSFSCGKAA